MRKIDIEKGEICLKITYQIKTKTIQKETLLKLERIECEKSEMMDAASIRI